MSIPIAQIRYAGVWNATNTYYYASLVLSPIDNELYVWPSYTSISGGSDPSVISSGWTLIPTTAGDITGIVAGTGLTGGGSSGNITLNNDGVLQLNSQKGNIALSSNALSPWLTIGSLGTGNIEFLVTQGAGGVIDLNTQSGPLSLTSANTNLVVGSLGSGNIELNVPTGAGGVSSLNTLTGGLTIAAGKNISVVSSGGNTLTINQINVPVTNRVSGSPNQRMTTTATTITGSSLTLPTTATYDVDVFGIVQFTSDSNTNYDITLRILQNGVQIGIDFVTTLQGVGHSVTMPIQATALSVPAGTQTYVLQGFVTGVPVNVNINATKFQICAIGNLA